MMLTVVVPVRTRSPNETSGEHWAARKRRAGAQRMAAWSMLVGHGPTLPCRVTLCRIAPSAGLDAHDNLRAALKPVVDGVADALDVDDRDPRVQWAYAQERGVKHAVRITVEPA